MIKVSMFKRKRLRPELYSMSKKIYDNMSMLFEEV